MKPVNIFYFKYIYITFMLYFVRTINTCRPNNVTILQCELDISP